MSMELTQYKVVPRSPIRGIGKDIIVKETKMKLNELQALKILLAGNQLFKGDTTPVTIKDFVPDVDPQCILVGSLVDDTTHKGSKFTASSECKVIGSPRDYVAPIIEATVTTTDDTKGDPGKGDTNSGDTTHGGSTAEGTGKENAGTESTGKENTGTESAGTKDPGKKEGH